MRTPKIASTSPSGRPRRKPVNYRSGFVIEKKDPSRVYRLINADPGRYAKFESSGWRRENLVEHLPGYDRLQDARLIDNAIHVGGGQKQILISIEKEFYDEDQENKAEEVNNREAAIKPQNSGDYVGAKFDVSRGS